MKNGKYKLDANQIRQICLGLARGKSFRAISRQTGLSINRVNRTAGRIQAVSGGKPEELVNLDDHQLLGRIYSTETSSIENYAGSVKGSKYIPDFEHIVSGLIVEKRMSVIETYRWYEEQCKKQNAEQLSQAYFYKIVNEELEKLHLKTPEYYMIGSMPTARKFRLISPVTPIWFRPSTVKSGAGLWFCHFLQATIPMAVLSLHRVPLKPAGLSVRRLNISAIWLLICFIAITPQQW